MKHRRQEHKSTQLDHCIVAVSGGIDSVVLLDMMWRIGQHQLTVAHFDHGIRQESADDARFVEGLAARYGLPCVIQREELGDYASEELARTRRYAFLHEIASARTARIVTAHHVDDVRETIAINVIRGTGWRGVAVFDNAEIIRPLRYHTKQELQDYAVRHRLEWVEDSTNATDVYLRNRVRSAIARNLKGSTKEELVSIWKHQVKLARDIDNEAELLLGETEEYSRYFFTHIETGVAEELLRTVVYKQSGTRPTRPQTERALIAIKTAKTGTTHALGKGASLAFTTRTFIVNTP